MAQIPVDIPILDGLGGQILGDDNGPIYLTVGYTATEVSGTFDDLTPFSSRPFIFTDQSISDVDPQTMPTNLVWEDDAPVGNVDWSFFTSAVTGFNTPRWSGRGANLISPSYAFVAEHAIGSGPYYWVQPDGTEIARTRVAAWHLIDIAFGPPPAVSDFTIIKLDTPITAIKPVPILEDSSLVADEPALIVEMNRQISTHLLANTLSNANHRTEWDNGNHALSGGDSGKPMLVLLNSNPVLVNTAVHGTHSAPNPSYWIAAINAILAQGGEELTVLRLV